MSESSGLPLEGVRILAVEQMQAMPFGTQLLARMGADVVKVEHPTRGESGRASAPSITDVDGSEQGATFLRNNLAKRSLGLDLKNPKGAELFEKLVPAYDVVVENFKPGTMERLGIGYDTLAEIHPGLVYVAVSGFGSLRETPYGSWPAYACVPEAMSGFYSFRPEPGRRPNIGVAGAIGDIGSGLFAMVGLLAALHRRGQTGRGQKVDVAMLDAMISLAWPEGYAGHTFVGSEADVPRNALAQDLVFETKDGFMTAGAVSDSEWHGLTRALDHPEWLDDDRFKTAGGRVAYAKERLDQTADVLRERTTDEWLERLDAEQVPCAPILPLSQIIEHPQIQATGVVVETDHPVAGRIRQTRAAARFEKTPTHLDRPAPTLGEHTDEIFAELGLER